jgi:release factor glutamine methyltransferase
MQKIKKPSSSRDCLKYVSDLLKHHNIANSQTEAEILISQISGKNRLDLYSENIEFNSLILSKLTFLLKKRISGIPIQYLIGKAFFYDLELRVEEGVFIPRPETEILVETTLDISKTLHLNNLQLLDIGTGCGNIAISLTKHLSSCKMTATDILSKSLKVARDNAKRYKLLNKITFIRSDLFKALDSKQKKDIIVSNPPYITLNEMRHLALEVKREPKSALFGGSEGLCFYKAIIEQAPFFLKSKGYLILELGKGRKNKVLKLINGSPYLEEIKIVKDYNQIERVLVAQKT